MNRRLSLSARLALVAAVTLACVSQAHSQPYPAHVQRHLDAATMNAMGDEDLIYYIRRNQCFEVEDLTWRTWARSKDNIRVPLTQIFDDLWVIGTQYTSSYFLKTADGGVVLIDALNNTADADNYLIPALQQLGLPLRGIYISHGHGDHDGGVNRLRQVYGFNFPVFLGSGDAANKPYQPTPIDSGNESVQSVTIGGTTLLVQATPGHTPGNQISLIPVHHNGERIQLVMNWRSAVPGSSTGSKQYVVGLERVHKMVTDYGAVGTIHTHPISDATLPTIERLMAGQPRTSTPLILGLERTRRAAAIARECAIARAAQIDTTASWPIWRATKMEFVGLSPSPAQLSAKLVSGWGPVANQQVTFRAASGAACVATTGQDGIATCTTMPTLRPREKVTASFDGTTYADHVELASSTDALATALTCDADSNSKVDRLDIRLIMTALGMPAAAGDPRDADGDGQVTVSDARMCTVKCTKPQCAP